MLQKAMEAGCFGATCTPLKTQAFTEANKCAVPDTVKEPVDGCKFLRFRWREIERKMLMTLVLGISKLPGMAM